MYNEFDSLLLDYRAQHFTVTEGFRALQKLVSWEASWKSSDWYNETVKSFSETTPFYLPLVFYVGTSNSQFESSVFLQESNNSSPTKRRRTLNGIVRISQLELPRAVTNSCILNVYPIQPHPESHHFKHIHEVLIVNSPLLRNVRTNRCTQLN